MIREAKTKWPELTNYLNAIGPGSDPAPTCEESGTPVRQDVPHASRSDRRR